MEIIEASSCSFAPGDRDSPRHSQWLQKTLSDMNERMKAMMTLLEEDGDSLDRVASRCKRRLELVQMLEEFNRSYRHLAETCDRLSSKFLVKDSGPAPLHSTIDSNKDTPIESSDNSNSEILDSHPQYVVEDPEIKCDSTNFDVEYLDKLVDELMLTEECKMKLKAKREIRENQMDKKGRDFFRVESISTNMNDYGEVQATARDFSEGSGFEWDNTWCELKFQITNLMEENLQHQAELARRNIEKKLVIDKLRLQLEHLKAENRSLQGCISCSKDGEKRNSLQRRGLLSGKFFGGGCT
ncbi:PREDICTED: uncharacterized protein LOC105140611 [Populus euphratica]|uniref:Uncharacterized protein LOC105140611 n=1 Tax=Populus euphratica TaxID=75702 RepID=A0AAJ6Y7X9_POPEU|nr:PREDICTED: uncharacterized protein LOC105140611 [Populus euphratica]